MNERERSARNTIRNYMYLSMGAGLIPVPLLDLVAVSGVQLKMVAAISNIYDVPFQESRGKALIGSLVGYVFPHSLSNGLICGALKAIPLVGALAGAPTMVLVSGATAWALGNVFIQHFESGGTFLDFDAEKVREYFRAQYEEGRKMALTMKQDEKGESPVNSGSL